jgi:hypothetical protein
MRKLAMLAAPAVILSACGGDTGTQPETLPVLNISVQPTTPQAGQKLTFTVSLTGGSGPWNVALFNESPDGSVDQIYPNRLPDGQATLTPGATLNVPPPNASYFFVAAGPFGTNTLLAYATQRALDLESAGISRYDNAQAQFARVTDQGAGTVDGPLLAKLKLLHPGIAKVIHYEVTDTQPTHTP